MTVLTKAFSRWRLSLGLTLLLAVPLTASPAPPESEWALCSDLDHGPPRQLSVEGQAGPAGRISIEARSSIAGADGRYNFEGDVRLSRDGMYLQAERVEYSRSDKTLSVYDDIFLQKDSFNAWGKEANFAFDKQTGEIRDSRFAMSERHVRGEAESIGFLGPRRYSLTGASYTTCMADNEAWLLKAKQVTLDYDSNTGTAKHVVLRFMNLPVFYFPYLSFPVAGRKTGLLVPEFGSTTNQGYNWLQPYYWNIAPNQDATLSLHPSTKRGMRYLGEYRYLSAIGGGVLNAEYIQRDKATDEQRWYYGFRAGLKPLPSLRASLDVQDVSDADYFDDFGDRLSSALVAHVPRDLRLNWRGEHMLLGGRFLAHRTIDQTIPAENRPYDLLPGLELQLQPLYFAGLNYGLSSDLTRFESGGARVEGQRVFVYQFLQAPLQGAAWFVTPRVFHRYLNYRLQQTDPSNDGRHSVSVPGYSLDTGVFLERDFNLAGQAFIQTLEPRLYYLYVPYRNQDGIITNSLGAEQVFDSAAAALSWEGLFRENRYAGKDRIGDADQLTVSLASRVLDRQRGQERLLAGVGRILYRQDRRVTVPGETVDTRRRSDIFAVLRAKPRDWFRLNTGLQWSEHLGEPASTWLLLSYNPLRYQALNLGYRLDRDPLTGESTRLEQDLSFYWKITTHFNIIGRRNRDVLGQVNRELLFGFEYDDCCWAFRAVSRRYLPADVAAATATDRDYRSVLMLQLVLKGLTSVGSSVDTLLKNTQYGVTGN